MLTKKETEAQRLSGLFQVTQPAVGKLGTHMSCFQATSPGLGSVPECCLVLGRAGGPSDPEARAQARSPRGPGGGAGGKAIPGVPASGGQDWNFQLAEGRRAEPA